MITLSQLLMATQIKKEVPDIHVGEHPTDITVDDVTGMVYVYQTALLGITTVSVIKGF
jgi:hypothetical protein